MVTFTPPTGLTVSAFKVWRHVAVGPTEPFGAPVTNLAYTGSESVEGLCAQSLGCTARGNPGVPLAAANEVTVGSLSGVTQVKWDAACGGAPAEPARPAAPTRSPRSTTSSPPTCCSTTRRRPP